MEDYRHNYNTNLNDSIGSEFFEEDRSVCEKMKTQPKYFNNIMTKVQANISYTNTDKSNSTNFNAKTKITSNDSSRLGYSMPNKSSNYNSDTCSLTEQKKLMILLKLKENEAKELSKKYDHLKRKINDRKKELEENIESHEKLHLINTNMKKLIISQIKENS